MALDKATLVSTLQAIFEDVAQGTTAADKATAIADAVEAYTLEALVQATIPAGTLVASATIPAGLVSVGVSPSVVVNPAPIPVTLVMGSSPVTINGDPDGDPDDAGGLS